MGAYSGSLDPDAVLCQGAGDFFFLHGCDLFCQLPRTGKADVSFCRNDVVGFSAFQLRQTNLSALPEPAGEGLVYQTLLSVDHRIFSVRRKAHDRNLPAVFQVIFHIGAACLFVQPEDDAHPPFQLRAGLFQRQQGIQSRHGRSLVIHRSPAIDAAVSHQPFIGRNRPAVSLGNHIQMAEHRRHLFSLAVLAPAELIIHIVYGKAQLPGRIQHIFQTVLNRFSIRISAVILSVYAGNPDAPLEICDQILSFFLYPFPKIHQITPSYSSWQASTCLLRSNSSYLRPRSSVSISPT